MILGFECLNVFIFILISVIQPLFEEVAFRGIILPIWISVLYHVLLNGTITVYKNKEANV